MLKLIFAAGAVILILLIINIRSCHSPSPSHSTPFTVSLDHIKTMRDVHLTRYYFEQIIPVEKKDKLKTLLIVPATIDAYIDMSLVRLEEDSVNYKFTLPEIRLSEVNFTLDSAKVYGFKNFGIYFSDNAYSEAIEDIQEGLRQARAEVETKAIRQGILGLAVQEARDFITALVQPVTEKMVEVK